jgi:hypothetical protein
MNNAGICILSEFMCFPSISINRFCSDMMDVEFAILFIGKRSLHNLYGSLFVHHKNFGLKNIDSLYGNRCQNFGCDYKYFIKIGKQYSILLECLGIV